MSDKVRTDQYDDRSDHNELQRTNTFLSITPEMFEKLYLSPKNKTKGELRQTFGNPTPVAVLGFSVALMPLSIELMGWRGATGSNSTIGANYFFGGMLLILSGIGEFLLGNTFPSVVFMGYGAHFLTFAATYTPFFAAISTYSPDGTQTPTPPFLAGFGFYALAMALLSLVFLICSLRTNAVFVLVFTSATIGFGLAAGGFWHLAEGSVSAGSKLVVGAGGAFFAASMFGWYLLFAIMIAAVDMPFAIPVFDLSTVIKGMSDKKKNN